MSTRLLTYIIIPTATYCIVLLVQGITIIYVFCNYQITIFPAPQGDIYETHRIQVTIPSIIIGIIIHNFYNVKKTIKFRKTQSLIG